MDGNGGPLEIKLDEDEDEAGHGEKPSGDHQHAVEDEPLVQLAALGSGPRLEKFGQKSRKIWRMEQNCMKAITKEDQRLS